MHEHSGIGTYIRALRRELGHREGTETDGHDILLSAAGVAESSPPPYSLREHLWFLRLARANPGALFHAPHINAPLYWPGPLVVTVHDLAHIRHPEAARRRGAATYARLMVTCLSRRADAIICVSEFTRSDLVSFAPSANHVCTVVPNGIDDDLTRPCEAATAKVLARYGLRPGYLLYLGNVRKHKNVDVLLAARLRLSKPRPTLVIAGADQMPARWEGRSTPGVRLLGPVPHEDKAALYAGASVFCFPSLFEGFGLPPLEAMRCGTPVVCSGATALPEILGEAAESVDVHNPSAVARAIDELLASPSSRRQRSRTRKATGIA
ncbi:glycosyltransferase family 4 protein, partial [Planctomycetota bacterium]